VDEEGHFQPCLACGASGDQLGHLLLSAYQVGLEHGLQWTRYGLKMAENPAEPMTVKRLRELVG
jgi:hypothetical protein